MDSIYIWAVALGWLAAHFAKFCFAMLKTSKTDLNWKVLFMSGGMPSAHSAVVASVLVTISGREGVDSAVFGLGLAVAAIVVYDAVNVRRSVGEQGNVLSKLVKLSRAGGSFYISQGHTLVEAVAGVVIGLLVGGFLLQIL